MLKGFIFDLDGVITDTAEYHYLAWKRLADNQGIPFSREDNEQLRGVSRRESLRRLLKGREIEEATAQVWMEQKNAYYQSFLVGMTPNDLLPGAREFLEAARAAGIKVGLASASRNAQTVLDGLQISALFDILGDGYAVINTKPAVDLFVWVAGGLKLTVTECVVFEDAEAGIDGALLAGMKCVGIGPAERVGKAHLICAGLHEITVERVLALEI
ncbi:MAG: beta-phosphoglucomutase [Chloroflexi bacterium]|nr:beta-phosphoglucomutase [Chloroflexota bacterium]